MNGAHLSSENDVFFNVDILWYLTKQQCGAESRMASWLDVISCYKEVRNILCEKMSCVKTTVRKSGELVIIAAIAIPCSHGNTMQPLKHFIMH